MNEPENTIRILVLKNTYRDSVELMRVAADLEGRPDVRRAGLVMGTPANRAILAEAGLVTAEVESAGPNDLVVALSGDATSVDDALAAARAALSGQAQRRSPAAGQPPPPRSLAEAVTEEPDSALAIISTPGAYATAEAFKALKRGLHVFLFSDNVSVEDEVALKTLARRKGLLVMGPDCGTAIIDGLPIGFANAVRRGRIGIVGASGTGLQEVTCLIDQSGEGISQAIGVGGRDLDSRVGGAMMLASLEYLAADPATEAVVLLSKPPDQQVADRVLEAARAVGKPVVVNFLGAMSFERFGDVVRTATLEDAAAWAVALARGQSDPPPSVIVPALLAAATQASLQLAPTQTRVEGLFSGGTLCKEAALVLQQNGSPHRLVDLGDDEYTVGRPHPMIDMRLRCERIVAAADDPETGVLLLDVVLGYASHPDPARELAAAIESARRAAAAAGRGLVVIASVCGTSSDPQGLDRQAAQLSDCGVLLAPTNAQAARLAAIVLRAASHAEVAV